MSVVSQLVHRLTQEVQVVLSASEMGHFELAMSACIRAQWTLGVIGQDLHDKASTKKDIR